MKKLITLVLVIFLVGCNATTDKEDKKTTTNKTADSFNLESRANDFITLLKSDGVDDMSIQEAKNNNIILVDQQCQIAITFKDDKVTHIKSSMIDYSNDDYSCVFRTLFQDKDLIGDNKTEYDKFMEMFRTDEHFTFNNLVVDNDHFNLDIEVK